MTRLAILALLVLAACGGSTSSGKTYVVDNCTDFCPAANTCLTDPARPTAPAVECFAGIGYASEVWTTSPSGAPVHLVASCSGKPMCEVVRVITPMRECATNEGRGDVVEVSCPW